MLNRIEPLRNELSSLENAAIENKHKYTEVQNIIAELERSISGYKEEYAVLISQAQAIKTDLANVEGKVGGAVFSWNSDIILRLRIHCLPIPLWLWL